MNVRIVHTCVAAQQLRHSIRAARRVAAKILRAQVLVQSCQYLCLADGKTPIIH